MSKGRSENVAVPLLIAPASVEVIARSAQNGSPEPKDGRNRFLSEHGSGQSRNILSCPQCGREYRATVTKCADCGVDLVWDDGTNSAPGLGSQVLRRLGGGVSVPGIIIGGLLVMFALSAGLRSQVTQVAAGSALIVRSFFLPLGFLRGLATWFGGGVVAFGIRRLVGPAASTSGVPHNAINPAAVFSAILFVGLGIAFLALGARKPRSGAL